VHSSTIGGAGRGINPIEGMALSQRFN